MHYQNYRSREMILRDHLAYDRTILALERTFLAYLRTAISLLAAGLTLILIYPDITASKISGTVLITGGIIAAIYGIYRTLKVHRTLSQIYHDTKKDQEN